MLARMIARLDPASFAQAILVESADIPVHMTLAQWRVERRTAARMSRRRRRRIAWALRRRLGL
jgi:hypothetical protein